MKSWLPSDASHRRAFWMGIAVGFAFRVFAYGVLIALLCLANLRWAPPLLRNLLLVSYWIAALASPLWVSFTAGFTSAYFWRHLPVRDYVRAIWVTAIAFVLLLAIISTSPQNIACFGLIVFCMDVGLCGNGVEQGNKFWNSYLGREFLGDFSTRDEADNSNKPPTEGIK